MLDPDDVTAIQLTYAVKELFEACQQLAEPRLGILEWVSAVTAVIITDSWTGRPLEELLLIAARRVTADIRLGL